MNAFKWMLIMVIMVVMTTGCGAGQTEKQQKVWNLRLEIREHVHTPCAKNVAKILQQDPGGVFYDMPAENILNLMRYSDHYPLFRRMRDDAMSVSNDLVRLVDDVSTFALRKVAYDIHLEMCKNTFMYQQQSK